MEYFTLSEDLEKIRTSKIKLRNRILIGLSVLILFFLLRGFGIITVEYNKSYFTGKHLIDKEISKYYSDGTGDLDSTQADLKTNYNYTHRDFGFSFRISGNAQSEDLEKLVKRRISEDKFLSKRFESAVVTVEKLETSGFYWLPLVKSGRNKYQVSVKNKFFEDTYSAVFTGETDFEVYGLCTIGKLDKIIAGEIADIVVKSIKEDYKK